jgi:hypothetical protein
MKKSKMNKCQKNTEESRAHQRHKQHMEENRNALKDFGGGGGEAPKETGNLKNPSINGRIFTEMG